jgi:hypothetical protein
VARLLTSLALATCLMAVLGFSSGCKQAHAQDSSNASEDVAKDLMWSYMVNDATPDARIRKWTKPRLRGLMIVDQSRAKFHQQFSPLLRQVGENIGVKIEVCRATVEAGRILPPSEPECAATHFDFHSVITNGSWTETEWHEAQLALRGQAGELLTELREQLATEQKGKTCRHVIRQSSEVSGQIELGVGVIDSALPIVLGKCGTYLFLHMMGLYPFEGAQPLDDAREAENLAAFLVKQEPFGATYLLRQLYASNVTPGMSKAEFIHTLPQ